MLRAGAVAFALLAGATAAALILAHYSGFDSWPKLLSGSEGTNAGSASLSTGPANGARTESFLDLGPGSLPFAPGTVTLPAPGVAPAGPGLLVDFGDGGGGPGGTGAGNGGGNGGGGNGGTPGGDGPGNPAGPGTPGGTPQQPGGTPGGGGEPGNPGATPGGEGPGEEPASPPNQPGFGPSGGGGGDDDGCNGGQGQSFVASDFDEGGGAKVSEGEDFDSADEPNSEPESLEPKSETESLEPKSETESYEPEASEEAAVASEESWTEKPAPQPSPAPEPFDGPAAGEAPAGEQVPGA